VGLSSIFFHQAFLPVVNDFYNPRTHLSTAQVAFAYALSRELSSELDSRSAAPHTKPFSTLLFMIPRHGVQYRSAHRTDALGSKFQWAWFKLSNLYANVEYKPDAGCEGRPIVRKCTLSPATVQYNTITNGNRSTISLAPNSTIYDDAIQSHYNVTETYLSGLIMLLETFV